MKSSLILAAVSTLALTGAASALNDTSDTASDTMDMTGSNPAPAVDAAPIDKPQMPVDETDTAAMPDKPEIARSDESHSDSGEKPSAGE